MTIHVPLTITPESPTAYILEWEGRKLVHFQEKGKLARLMNADPDLFADPDLLRWAAPFALASQGLVCLHASAAHKEGTTIGFVGIGGAGKSTLAREFSRQSWQPIADDLMVCDGEGRVNAWAERVLRQWCRLALSHRRGGSRPGGVADVGQVADLPTSKAGWQPAPHSEEPWIDYGNLATQLAEAGNQCWLPISGLCFLNDIRGEDFVLSPLSSGDQFRRLVRFGFGGLPATEAWAHQFEVYATLAQRVPAASLQVPQGLDQLRSALPQLEDSLSQWLTERAPIHI